jgi:hypothetical protein
MCFLGKYFREIDIRQGDFFNSIKNNKTETGLTIAEERPE